MAPAVKTVHIAVSDDVWREFRARCTFVGVELRARLAELVELDNAGKCGQLSSPQPAIAPVAGQLELPATKPRRRSPRKPAAAAAKPTKSARRRPSKRERPLPVADDREVAREAAAGRRAARKSK